MLKGQKKTDFVAWQTLYAVVVYGCNHYMLLLKLAILRE